MERCWRPDHGTASSPCPRAHPRAPVRELQAIVYAGKDPLTDLERYERETAKTYQAAEIALTRLQARVDEIGNRSPI